MRAALGFYRPSEPRWSIGVTKSYLVHRRTPVAAIAPLLTKRSIARLRTRAGISEPILRWMSEMADAGNRSRSSRMSEFGRWVAVHCVLTHPRLDTRDRAMQVCAVCEQQARLHMNRWGGFE